VTGVQTCALPICRLRKIRIPFADGVEQARLLQANELVSFPRQYRTSFRRCDGERDYDSVRFELAQRADGRKHAGTRRCAVVHEYDDALPEAPGRSASAIQSFATRELCLLAGLGAPPCSLAHQL